MNVLTRTAFIGIIAVGHVLRHHLRRHRPVGRLDGGADRRLRDPADERAGGGGWLAGAGGRDRAWPSRCVLGAVFGLAHGLLITRGRIEPFIVTLGTLGIFRAYLTYFANGGAITLDNALVRRLQPGVLRQPARHPDPGLGVRAGGARGRADPQPHRLRPLRAGHRLQRAGRALRRRRRRPGQDADLHAARPVRGHRHAALRAAARLGLADHRPAVGAGGDRRGDRRRHRAARAAPAASPAR